MRINGVQGMNYTQLSDAVARGGRFVYYQYCISVLVMSFKRSSDIHFIPPGESRARKGLPSTLQSLLLGWWGIPWGPIWTIATVAKNASGGTDVTARVMQSLAPQQAPQPVRSADMRVL